MAAGGSEKHSDTHVAKYTNMRIDNDHPVFEATGTFR